MINEAFALRGRLEAITQDEKVKRDRLAELSKEAARLKVVQEQCGKAQDELDALMKEKAQCDSDLGGRLRKLKDEGVILPLGKTEPVNKSVRL